MGQAVEAVVGEQAELERLGAPRLSMMQAEAPTTPRAAA
jgi:hypothetical protein